MKYVFIINPKSGKSELKEELLAQIELYKEKIDYEIYYTKESKDATNYVKNYCKYHNEDTVFCACGGDGTLNEIVSGAINYNNAIVTCFPCGSGNDFVKVYGGKEKFLNLSNIINGEEIKIDVMKVNDLYALNVTNFGFDASVCSIANSVRRKPLIGGKYSYTTGIVCSLIVGMKTKCKVIADDEVLADNKILLSTVANGKYVGGAYYCAPYSDNQDGLLEVSVVKPISIFRFIKLIGPYKKGTHLDGDRYKNIIKYRRVKKVVIEANEGFKICLDGEMYSGTRFEIEDLKQAIRFIKPNSK